MIDASRRRMMAGAIAALLGLGLLSMFTGRAAMAQEPAYFSDPEAAVGEIARLLRGESWPDLARYYDLSGTDIARDTLNSGKFFVRDERPTVGHPGGFDYYKQPFAPGFSYLSHQSVALDTVEVTVEIEIDQGGGLVQRGLDLFRMRKSARGYQLLPKPSR